MVEVPLEIEAELPREFDGAALLASSGLPRKVKIKAQRDALKLSTAYRADQLMADIVRMALRGTPQDAARVQEATRAFVRTVRERRQDGATLLVSSNGRGKIEVLEQLPERTPKSAARIAPISEPPLSRAAGQGTLADRVASLEKRLGELETGFARIAASSAEERVALLEGRFTALQSRTDLAGPMMEAHPGGPATMELSRTPGAPRRTTAVEAFAEGLRDELRARVTEQLQHARRATEICDKAAALAAEAESVLGAPRDGTAQRLRLTAAATAARMTGLSRVAEEVDLYQPADLGIASQLVGRLEDGPARIDTPDPATPLQLQAEALVRAARGADAEDRANWLRRAAALCGWTLIEPEVGGGVHPDLAQVIQGGGGGSAVVAVAAPGLRRNDGSVLVRARVLTSVAETADEEVEVLASSGAGESELAAGARGATAHQSAAAGARDSVSAPGSTSDAAPASGSAPTSDAANVSALPNTSGSPTPSSPATREITLAPASTSTPDSTDAVHSGSSSNSALLPDSARTQDPAPKPDSAGALDAASASDSANASGSAGAPHSTGQPNPPSGQDFERRRDPASERDPAAAIASASASALADAEAVPFGDLAGTGDISPGEAEAAAVAAARVPKVVGDEAVTLDTALAAQVALAVKTEVSTDSEWAQVARGPDGFGAPAGPAAPPRSPPPVEEDDYEVSDADVEEIQDLDPGPDRNS